MNGVLGVEIERLSDWEIIRGFVWNTQSLNLLIA
jgi:hypothetical protein